MTQKYLIKSMYQELINEVVYQIKYNNKTSKDKKELSQLIRNKKRDFNLLLETMKVKKQVRGSFSTILNTEVSDEIQTLYNKI